MNINEIDINKNSTLFKGNYHFLNNIDFNLLCSRMNTNNDVNVITIANDVYLKFNGDISDFGNEIGLKIGRYITNDDGFEKSDIISGFEHGISIANGTHF